MQVFWENVNLLSWDTLAETSHARVWFIELVKVLSISESNTLNFYQPGVWFISAV